MQGSIEKNLLLNCCGLSERGCLFIFLFVKDGKMKKSDSALNRNKRETIFGKDHYVVYSKSAHIIFLLKICSFSKVFQSDHTNAPHISIIIFKEYSVIIGSFHTQGGSC